jgi:transcriptional regulator with XRE-family HTH domain
MGRANAYACYRELGGLLRNLRIAAGLSAAELARQAEWEQSKVSRIESGHAEISDLDLVRYVAPCGIYGNHARDLIAMCRKAQLKLGYWLSPQGEWLPDSLTSLIFHESSADSSTTYEPHLIPGLLQTAEYARARIGAERWRAAEDVEKCVDLRLERQRILRVSRSTPFAFFLHEDALRHQVGGPAVMHEQLLKLVLLSGVRHITVRVVLSAESDQHEFGGPFRIFEYREHRPLIYLDNRATGLFLEDHELVEPYLTLLPVISQIALDEGQSRDWIAALASEYDRGSARDDRLEEEQL